MEYKFEMTPAETFFCRRLYTDLMRTNFKTIILSGVCEIYNFFFTPLLVNINEISDLKSQ